MVQGCAPSQPVTGVKYCDVRVQKLDWVKFLSQYNIEEISDIWENVRAACLRMKEGAVHGKPDFDDKLLVKKDISEDSLLKMIKTDLKTSVYHSFEDALDNGLIKAAIRDTLVELAAIKSPSKHLQKVQNLEPVTTGASDDTGNPGLIDPRSLFLSNFGLKPVIGSSEGLHIKPRRASKRLKSQATVPSHPPLVSELSSLLLESESGAQTNRRPSKSSSTLSHKNKVAAGGQGDLRGDKVETINENVESKDLSVRNCSVMVRKLRITSSTELVDVGDCGIVELFEDVHELSVKEQDHQASKTTEQALVCEPAESGSSEERRKNSFELDVISDGINSSFEFNVSDAVMDFIETELDEGDVAVDLDKDASREYVEPGLDDVKNCMDMNETVISVRNEDTLQKSCPRLHVTDYGSFRVTRSRSEPRNSACVSASSESAESFRDYKKRMQTKLKANLKSSSYCEGGDMDIDSDNDDEHSIWQPSKNGEDEKEPISSDEEYITVARINLDGILENYKCNNLLDYRINSLHPSAI